jgi:AcrR family transcriptional regulator
VRLIEAAASAFAKQGYAKTAVRDICVEAGLSVGSFYYHFADKAEITLAILERESERFIQRLDTIDLHLASSIESALNELVHGPTGPLYTALREAVEIEPRLAEAAAEIRRHARDRLAAVISRARAAGSTFQLDARLVAWAFLALVREALARRADAAEDELTRGIANIIHQAVIALGE